LAIRPINALGTFRTFRTLWPFRTIDPAHAFHFFRALRLVNLPETSVLIDSLRPVTPDNVSNLNT